jgi:hypothetical protein
VNTPTADRNDAGFDTFSCNTAGSITTIKNFSAKILTTATIDILFYYKTDVSDVPDIFLYYDEDCIQPMAEYKFAVAQIYPDPTNGNGPTTFYWDPQQRKASDIAIRNEKAEIRFSVNLANGLTLVLNSNKIKVTADTAFSMSASSNLKCEINLLNGGGTPDKKFPVVCSANSTTDEFTLYPQLALDAGTYEVVIYTVGADSDDNGLK